MKSNQYIMIEIKNLTLQRGLKVLLNQASATITPRQRIGLIGKNGTGKSSLFALLKIPVKSAYRKTGSSQPYRRKHLR